MTPDTPEGLQRLSRLEERVDSNRRQIDTLAPLVRDVGRLQWGLDDLANDLKELRDDMRAQRLEDEKKRNDELHDLRRSVSQQILVVTDGLKGCSDKITEVADTQRKHHEAEQRRREEEQKTVRVEKSQDVVSRRTLYGILGAAGIAAIAAIVAPILNAILG
jgi:DNA repair ATPase RecN